MFYSLMNLEFKCLAVMTVWGTSSQKQSTAVAVSWKRSIGHKCFPHNWQQSVLVTTKSMSLSQNSNLVLQRDRRAQLTSVAHVLPGGTHWSSSKSLKDTQNKSSLSFSLFWHFANWNHSDKNGKSSVWFKIRLKQKRKERKKRWTFIYSV